MWSFRRCLHWFFRWNAPNPGPWFWVIFKATLIPFAFVYLANQYSKAEKERERARTDQAILRQMTISTDRDVVARMLAVSDRLNIHVYRFNQLKGSADLDKIEFEARAAFFFYGMLRSENADFNAKGSVMFSRNWLRDIFELSVDQILTVLSGGTDFDTDIPLEDEAIIYFHFGGEAGQKSKLLTTLETLEALDEQGESVERDDPDTKFYAAYKRFRSRLDTVKWEHLHAPYAAMKGSSWYSFAIVMPPSYGISDESGPMTMPAAMPEGFRRNFPEHPNLAEKVWNYMNELQFSRQYHK